jgi:hypothetical protein
MLHAACRSSPTLNYFPKPREKADPAVLAVCEACPVKKNCLDYAMGMETALASIKGKPVRVGVWGGLTGQERSALAGRQNRLKEVRPRLGFLCRNGHDRWKLRGNSLYCMDCGCHTNLARKVRKPIRKNPCKVGHDNWTIDSRNQTRCVTCTRIHNRARKEAAWEAMSPAQRKAFKLRTSEYRRRYRLRHGV